MKIRSRIVLYFWVTGRRGKRLMNSVVDPKFHSVTPLHYQSAFHQAQSFKRFEQSFRVEVLMIHFSITGWTWTLQKERFWLVSWPSAPLIHVTQWADIYYTLQSALRWFITDHLNFISSKSRQLVISKHYYHLSTALLTQDQLVWQGLCNVLFSSQTL